MKPLRHWWQWFGISAIVIALDLYTKQLVQSALAYGEHRPVTGFFDIVLFYNTGAAFSFLAGASGWQRPLFTGFALLASGVMVYLLRKHSKEPLFCLALAMFLGGALGNLWDRVTLGHVVDFLYFHYQAYDFPAFNVADSAITGGVMLMLWDGLHKGKGDA